MNGFQGQLQDFGAFYESTYPVAFRVAYGVVGERALAEDATQEAYVTAYRKRGSRRQCRSAPGLGVNGLRPRAAPDRSVSAGYCALRAP